MLKRFEYYSPGASDRRALQLFLVASLLLHAAVIGLLVLLAWGSHPTPFVTGYKVSFIPKGHVDGAPADDPNAAPVAAPPSNSTEEPAPSSAPATPPTPTPPKAEPPKPKPQETPETPKPKEVVKTKAKPEKEPKVKPDAPPKEKTEKPKDKPKEKPRDKPKDIPKDKQDKPDKATKTSSSKNQKVANLEPIDSPDPTVKGKGAAKPQQGHANGEAKKGVEMHAGADGDLDWWATRVQSLIERKWETPEGILIVPDKSAAVVRFSVDRKGQLMGEPEVTQEASDPAVGRSGVKAVMEAAPFPSLPEEFAGNERQVEVTFNLVK